MSEPISSIDSSVVELSISDEMIGQETLNIIEKENKSNFFDEILMFDTLLQENKIEPDLFKRMVLAREIALIEHLDETFKFHDLISCDGEREQIRYQILDELINHTIPKNDDDITIGFGGCKPRNRIRKNRKAIILLGLPASGKSTVAQVMSDMQGAYIVDSDFAKRKFPELAFPNGANWTHEESDNIVMSEYDGLFAKCISEDANMVIPKIGAKADSIKRLYGILKQFDYDVSLGLVWLEPQKALERAIKRYSKSKRYIPILKITDEYGEKPLSVYHQLLSELNFENHVYLSSDVNLGEPYEIVKLSKDCIWW